MTTNSAERPPPNFAESEWAALKALVLKFVYYDVYCNHLSVKCQMIEDVLAAHRTRSARMSKQELESESKRWHSSIVPTVAEQAEELGVIRKLLAEDAPEALIRWYYEEHDGRWGATNWWYDAAKNCGFLP
jgi:hypothetical protein